MARFTFPFCIREPMQKGVTTLVFQEYSGYRKGDARCFSAGWHQAGHPAYKTLHQTLISALNISRGTSGSCPRFILARDRVRPPIPMDVVVPAIRWSSLGERRIFGHRSTGMECVTAHCHVCTVPFFIPATSELFFSAATASITLITAL